MQLLYLNTTYPDQKALLDRLLYLCEWQMTSREKEWIQKYIRTFAEISRDADRFPNIMLLDRSTDLFKKKRCARVLLLPVFHDAQCPVHDPLGHDADVGVWTLHGQ